MTWVQTFTGVSFDLRAPRAEDVRAADLAHALAFSCRFGGHTRSHVSVAQHSIFVAALCWHRTHDQQLALAGLLHDAHEAYTGDIKKPVKDLLCSMYGASALSAIEEPIDEAIAAWAGLDLGGHLQPSVTRARRAIKKADIDVLFFERDRFMGEPSRAWVGEERRKVEEAEFTGGEVVVGLFHPWAAPIAERAFTFALGVLLPQSHLPANQLRAPAPPAWLVDDLRVALGAR